jgi:predicted dehydrogenase
MSDNYDLKSAAAASIAAPDLPYGPPMPRAYRPRIGLIGCGGITQHHLKAYRAAGWEVVAFHDHKPAAAEARRDEFYPQARVCASAAELLSTPGLDVVDIATHPEVRGPLIEQAIVAGKHVLSQKPFVLDLAEGERLVRLARDHGVKLAVNQNGRWAPYFCYLRQLVRAGLLGEIASVHITINWDHTWCKGTAFEKVHHLVLYDFGIHWFDAACSFLPGARPRSVSAAVSPAPLQPIAPPLVAASTVVFDRGLATLAFNGHGLHGSLERCTLVGSLGTAHASGPVCGISEIELHTAAGRAVKTLDGSWFPDGFRGAMGELLCAIEDDREPENSAANNLTGLGVCFAALRAADEGRVQTLT